MNKKQQQLFIAFFDQIVQAEEALNLIKIKLSQVPGYNPLHLFNMLAIGGQHITVSQMRMYMTQRLSFNQRELYDIFEHFDWDRQGFISRRDFLRQITPFNYADGSLNLTGGSLSAQVEGLFISLLIEIIKRFRILQVSRKEVMLIPPYDAFGYLDPMKTGILGLNQLNKFFVHNDFRVTNQQLRLLLHGLRRRTYLQVNLEVFCENITPLQFGQYEGYAIAIEKQIQKDVLKRSRHQQQLIRRSRVQQQKNVHQIMKAERRKQAEIQRQVQLETRVNAEILNHEAQRQRMLRKAVLEEDRRLRLAVQQERQILHERNMRSILQAEKNAQLAAIQSRQRQINQGLARSALLRQREIQNSRRLFDYQRQLVLRQQIQRDKQVRRLGSRAQQLQLQRSRKQRQQQLVLSKISRNRQLQLDRIRQMQSNKYTRMQQIQKQLSKTRAQMKQRRAKLQSDQKSRRGQNSSYRKAGDIGSITKSYYV